MLDRHVPNGLVRPVVRKGEVEEIREIVVAWRPYCCESASIFEATLQGGLKVLDVINREIKFVVDHEFSRAFDGALYEFADCESMYYRVHGYLVGGFGVGPGAPRSWTWLVGATWRWAIRLYATRMAVCVGQVAVKAVCQDGCRAWGPDPS